MNTQQKVRNLRVVGHFQKTYEIPKWLTLRCLGTPRTNFDLQLLYLPQIVTAALHETYTYMACSKLHLLNFNTYKSWPQNYLGIEKITKNKSVEQNYFIKKILVTFSKFYTNGKLHYACVKVHSNRATCGDHKWWRHWLYKRINESVHTSTKSGCRKISGEPLVFHGAASSVAEPLFVARLQTPKRTRYHFRYKACVKEWFWKNVKIIYHKR